MKPDDFAESKGIARSTLHRVIKNEMQTVSVRQMISDEVINIPVKEIWPEQRLKEETPYIKYPSHSITNGFVVGTASIVAGGKFFLQVFK